MFTFIESLPDPPEAISSNFVVLLNGASSIDFASLGLPLPCGHDAVTHRHARGTDGVSASILFPQKFQ